MAVGAKAKRSLETTVCSSEGASGHASSLARTGGSGGTSPSCARCVSSTCGRYRSNGCVGVSFSAGRGHQYIPHLWQRTASRLHHRGCDWPDWWLCDLVHCSTVHSSYHQLLLLRATEDVTGVSSARGPDSSVGGVPVANCPDVDHMEAEVQVRVQVEVEREEQGIGEKHGKEQVRRTERENKQSNARHG